MRGFCIAICAIALSLAAAPAGAWAYVVDSRADTHDISPGDNECADSSDECTLRAALEENAAYPYGSSITFDASFDGGSEDAIYIGSPLEVPDWVSIDGGGCDPLDAIRPCVWVGYPQRSTQPAMTLAYQTAIRSIAIGNAGTALFSDGTSPLIQSNWIGLGLDGKPTAVDIGVDLLGGYGTTVGGTTEQGNRIAARQIGVRLISPQSGGQLHVMNNWIGIDPQISTATVRPSIAGVMLLGGGRVEGNRIAASGGAAVLVKGQGMIERNWIGVAPNGTPVGGGNVGVQGVYDPSSYGGLQLIENVIGNVSGPGVLSSAGMGMVGNLIGEDLAGRPHPNSGPGVRVSASGVGIGVLGRDEHFPNVISNSGGAAIEVMGDGEPFAVTVGRNTGTGNKGLFIDLGGDGPGNPKGVNDGVSAPRITASSPTLIRGFANAYSTVNVYLSATGSRGDFTAFLGEARAGIAGQWQLPVSTPLASSAYVAATQYWRRRPEGTSEAAFRRVDAQAPSSSIKITRVQGRMVTFRLSANERQVAFRCAIDSDELKPCPRVFRRRLSRGRHRMRAVAEDTSGNVETTPSGATFRLK